MIAIEDEPVRGLRARVEFLGRLHPCDQTPAVSLEILGGILEVCSMPLNTSLTARTNYMNDFTRSYRSLILHILARASALL
jgi:hypothetical protein